MSLFGGALNNLHIPSIGGMKKQFNKVITDQAISYDFFNIFSSFIGGMERQFNKDGNYSCCYFCRNLERNDQ